MSEEIVEARYPMTPTQQGIMFQSDFGGRPGLFHVQVEYRIEQELDVEAFRRSWLHVMERHTALRTGFRDLQSTTPLQEVHQRLDVPFAVEDWRGLSAEEQRSRLQSYKQRDLARGFSLAEPPLWRLHVARLDEACYQVVWSLHYIVLDGWSQTIILREVESYYGHLTADRPLELHPATPYQEYVRWLGRQDIDQAERYWTAELESVAPAAPLPMERKAAAGEEPNAAAAPADYDQTRLLLDEGETARLSAVGEQHGLSLETMIQGCWALLVSRYTGAPEVVVGATVSGRSGDLPGVEQVVGLLINTLPLRIQVPQTMPWAEWMHRVRRQYAQIQRHEHSPMLLVQQWSEIGSGNALFESVVSVEHGVQPEPGQRLPITGRREETRVPYPLNVVVTPGERLAITIHFDTRRFDRRTVEGMLGHLRQICSDLVRLPHARLAEISVLTAAEHSRLVYEWNDTEKPYARDLCMHQLFERQVRRSPDAPALFFQDRSWTYAEVNRQANQISHYLKGLGVGPGVHVAILMERAAEMIPALLGILKAGGIYVPLQTGAPVKRWHGILDSLGITCILTQRALVPSLLTADPLPELAHIVCVDDADEDSEPLQPQPYRLHAPADIARMPQDDLPLQGTSQDLAYIIFTSGSTGTPKGVMVEHRAAINLIEWVNDTFSVGPDDRLLFITSLSFDLSVYDIFGILAAGGSIRLAAKEDIQEPTRLLDILATEPITFWDSAPAALMQLVPFLPGSDNAAGQVVSTSLRLIFMSGDWIPVNSPDIMKAAFPNVQVIGLGGATEATVWSNFFPVHQVDPAWTSIPYGKPIQNACYYILNENLQPCPVDVPGDLYIGGDCLSLGYAEDPQLTASKYIASPFSAQPGARIYKTGDMARWRADGNLEFLGRTDSQVKIRGYRIELGEIDTVLSRHPVVKTAATLVRTDQPGGASLVSFVVLDPLHAQSAVEGKEAGLLDDRLQHWQQVYDAFDELEVAPTEDGADYSGWNSSYTGQAIPLEEMEAWRQDTLALVRAYRPQSLLEIGCGTGLLLFPLAPDCARYYGTDFSRAVLESVRRRLDGMPQLRDSVTLLQRQADDLADLHTEAVDTVLINSVIQYFPDIHYLVRVLNGALERVDPGGRIIVGDVRSLPLLEAFAAAVELSRASEATSRQELWQRVQQRVQQEKELTLDPSFFRDWAASTGRISRVEIRLKRGRHRNELTQFRYQVVLHVGKPVPADRAPEPPGAPEQDWSAAGLTLAGLRELLERDRPDRLRLRDVPNARVVAATQTLRWLKGESSLESVEAWRAQAPAAGGVDPEDVWELAEQLGYDATINWGRHGVDGGYTVLLRRADAECVEMDDDERIDPTTGDDEPDWQRYANHPLRAEIEDLLIPQIKAYLQERLPDYMVPADLVVLENLPITSSGKLDRRALPLNQPAPTGGSGAYVPARTTTEGLLVSIYEQVLSRSPIGIHDDFFELGGHSLLAVQLAARIRRVFSVDLPVRTFFDLPTIARIAPELQRLQQEAQPLQMPPLVPASRDTPVPASFDQQRLFFLDRLNPGSTFYTINWLIPLAASAPRGVIEAGLHEMIRRHESLRTTFHEENGQVWQVIADDWQVELPVLDLSTVPADQRETRAKEEIRELWGQPFDLAQGPLLRAMLINLSDTERLVVLGAHHIVFDGYSIGLFSQEFLQLCHALTTGAPDPLPEVAIQYGDYAVWQQNWLREEWIQFHLAYWKEQLAEAPDLLTLPTDFPRPEVQRYQGSFLRRQLSLDLTERIKQFSGEAQVTNYITMLAGAAVLLARYSRQDMVVLGVPIANRHRVELEPMIGFLVNTVALCVDLRGNPTFSEVLLQVRRQLFDAQAHQEIPFDRVVEALRPERNLSYSPIFQVMVADESISLLEHAPDSVPPAPWMRDLVEEGMSLRISRFDIVLMVREDSAGLRLGFEYNTDLFRERTVGRMADHLQELLESALAQPERPVQQLSMLPEDERAQIVEQWSGVRTEGTPRLEYLHELFEAQTKRTPDSIAVVYEEEQVSYAELDGRANQLAHWLQGQGVGPDVLVGLCVERSVEVIVGMLGILKAGGAYVTLDPNYPRDRLAFLIEDAGLRLILTQSHLQERLPAEGVPTLCLDSGWSAVAQESRETPPNDLTPENLAYIIYTSGSTGRPKGVMVAHRCINNIVPWQRENPCFSTPHNVLQVASYSFDFSVWEISMPLVTGGTLHIPRRGTRMIGSDLHDVVVERAIESLNFTPSALATLPKADLPHLRTIVLGGEAFSADLVRTWAPGRNFFNGYGPTETTVFSNGTRLDENADVVHMGRPITNVELYVLDSCMQPVPVGVPGELYIGGVGVTRGYLNRPELTAQYFVANPFGGDGSRLYRSGDLVRYLPDGNIEYLGRIDHQVKIRGFRIELGEIESALAEHPQVEGAAVLVHEEAGTKRLVAYVASPEPLSPEALQAFLGDRLPSFMVPRIFLCLDQLPLSSNGKLDRRALAAIPWEQHAATPMGEYTAPRNLVEQRLAEIWGAVLAAADPVSIHDNFFALGGDSILSLQVIFRAKQAGLHFSVKQLFQHQTIAELSHVVVQQDAASVQAEQGPVTGRVELTPIQRWFFAQEFDRQEHFNQSLLLEVPAELTPSQWQRVLRRLLEHHDGLRARYVQGADGWQAELVAPPESVTCQVYDLSFAPAQRAQLLDIARQVQASLVLAEAPLFRAVLFTGLKDGRHRLLLAVHHLVVDVVSWRVLLEDLAALSEQVRQGQELALPAKSSSWQQWAARLRQEASSDTTLAEVPYWLEQVEPTEPLPLDDDPDRDGALGGSRACEVSLGREETRALLQDVPAAFNTRINDVLLTAVAAALGSWTRGTHVRVDLEGHGREDLFGDIDLSRTVGWFTTISPVRLPVPSATAPAEGLKEIKELLRRRPRQGIGYGLLVNSQSDAAAQLRRAPAAQVSFNHLGAFDGADSFAAAYGAVDSDIAPENRRPYLLEIVSLVRDGELRMQWTYHEAAHQQQTVERVARQALDVLVRLAGETRRPDLSGYSPSDLPISGLTQPEINDLVGQLRALPAWRNSELARPLEDVYPQTPLQQGLWFQSQFAQGQGLYHVQMIHDIDLDLQVEVFRQSWAEVMRRHPILRTSFWSRPGHEAMQLVWRQIPVPLETQDWRSDSPQQQRERLDAYLKQDRIQGFEPNEIPQWRMLLARTADEHYQFILSMHHAILDGWSYALLLSEVVQCYEALSHGRQDLAQPVRPYRDYVAWLREQDMREAEHYWRGMLQGIEEAAPLSIERHDVAAAAEPREHVETSVLFGEEESIRLQELAQRHRLTLNTIMQGCWALLLSRYEDTDDVAFGVVVSGRPAEVPEVERSSGLFINTLPLRVRVPGEKSWIDWMRGLQEQNIQLRQYEYSPLDQVQRWSGLPSGAELFNTLFVFENYPVEQPRDTALRLTKPERSEERIHYPLGAVVVLRGQQLHLTVQYDPRRFEPETIDRVMAHFQYLCAQMVESPEAPLAQFSILTEQERRQLLQQWNTPSDDSDINADPDLAAIAEGIEQSADPELLAQLLAEIQGLSSDDLLAQIQDSSPAAEKSEANE
ncbi:non-ribosomal peptide synthetase [Micromonospora olivasterospora]|uniref:Non-ribosomal peptide synthase protein (TIGR01720 family)/amino acid adenylation domain-containing protein n=1 Tax=Micromonospora olivasterospora TaxID=1880 RepID=A0A562IAR9_MICOL|nr:non-ribosomal peptide synthetase [Micromonospora olivasterospora]TWH68110.1 non-ribosomal peptide synthase protein (TIGR01720 family)/amino acid adenylation domain-containing protein [Micromonospora olivasterospora]